MTKVKNTPVRLVSRGESLLLSHPARQTQIPSLLGSFLVNWATSHTGAGSTSYTYYEQLEVSTGAVTFYLMPPAALTGTRTE